MLVGLIGAACKVGYTELTVVAGARRQTHVTAFTAGDMAKVDVATWNVSRWRLVPAVVEEAAAP